MNLPLEHWLGRLALSHKSKGLPIPRDQARPRRRAAPAVVVLLISDGIMYIRLVSFVFGWICGTIGTLWVDGWLFLFLYAELILYSHRSIRLRWSRKST